MNERFIYYRCWGIWTRSGLVERINCVNPTWNLVGFIDDQEELWGTYEDGIEVLGSCEYLKSLENVYAVCAIGSAQIRKKIIEKFKESSVKFATLIDPSVVMSKRVKLGLGDIICAGTILTTDIVIGNHVIINLACTLGHDDVIEDFVTIYPNANISGNVLIGSCSELGTGMKIIQGKRITSNTIIGAGAVVIKDCIESGTYVGNPTRKIK